MVSAAAGKQLLEVVQDEEDRPLPEVAAEGFARRPVGRFPDAEGDGDRRLQQDRVAERGEVHEPDAMRELVASRAGDREGEPGLAAAAGSGQRDDPARAEVGSDAIDLVLPADERRDLARKVRGDLRRPEGARIVGRAGDDEPVERDGLLEVLDGSRTVVNELDVGQPGETRQPARQRCHERVRQDDLSAVPAAAILAA